MTGNESMVPKSPLELIVSGDTSAINKANQEAEATKAQAQATAYEMTKTEIKRLIKLNELTDRVILKYEQRLAEEADELTARDLSYHLAQLEASKDRIMDMCGKMEKDDTAPTIIVDNSINTNTVIGTLDSATPSDRQRVIEVVANIVEKVKKGELN